MRLVVTVRMVHAREQDQREWTGVAMFKMVSALIAAVEIKLHRAQEILAKMVARAEMGTP